MPKASLVPFLAERGATPDPVANDLPTLTIRALWSGHAEAARYLAEQGENVNASGNRSEIPWDRLAMCIAVILQAPNRGWGQG